MIKLVAGMVIEATYKGEARKARIEPNGVKPTYVKVFDLDKQDYRTFSLDKFTLLRVCCDICHNPKGGYGRCVNSGCVRCLP